PDLGRRASIDFGEDRVEPPEAGEARAEGDLRHREVRAVEEALGALDAGGLRHLQRTGAEMLAEEAGKMPGAHAEARRQRLDIAIVEGASLDEADGALDGCER